MRPLLAALVLAGLLAARTAGAETRRVAVVVGNNAGGGAQPPLRFAETDAGKVARVLVDLGGVQPDDLFLLQGRDRAALGRALSLAGRRVAWHQRDPSDRVVLLFYFSGHSDGVALELGRDRLPFSELRRWLRGSGAEVRVALVDSCKSGALLAIKGGRPALSFQIRLTDQLASAGEAILTSSAADEVALESSEIRGSFFTHHFVSGLRGAADVSGDGTVTLTEAYRYAYAHTIATSGATTVGPQHPEYDYRLAGQGELVLTELTRPGALLELPRGFDRALVIELARDQVIAELTSDARRSIAVPPGRYALRVWRRGRVLAGRLEVADAGRRRVRWAELRVSAAAPSLAKGEATAGAALVARHASSPGRRPTIFAAAGGQGGVADGVGALAAVRLGVRTAGAAAASLTLDLASGRGPGFRETSLAVAAGARIGRPLGPVEAWLGLDLAGGAVLQSADRGDTAGTPFVSVGALAGVAAPLTGAVSAVLEARVPAALLRRDGEAALLFLPAAWLGLSVSL